MENRQNIIRQENDKAEEIQKLIELKIREHHNLLQIQELKRQKNPNAYNYRNESDQQQC